MFVYSSGSSKDACRHEQWLAFWLRLWCFNMVTLSALRSSSSLAMISSCEIFFQIYNIITSREHISQTIGSYSRVNLLKICDQHHHFEYWRGNNLFDILETKVWNTNKNLVQRSLLRDCSYLYNYSYSTLGWIWICWDS